MLPSNIFSSEPTLVTSSYINSSLWAGSVNSSVLLEEIISSKLEQRTLILIVPVVSMTA